MKGHLRAKIIFCSVCSATLHFLFLGQISIGQTEPNRPIAGRSELKIRYILNVVNRSAVEADSTKLPAENSRELRSAMPIQLTEPSSAEMGATAVQLNESVVVENFFDSSDVDEPASPETDWPILVGGMAIGLTFNVQASVWISSRGRIERVEVIQIQPESEKVRFSLQTMVGAMVRPALRGGVNVANRRQLEVWLTQ